MPPVETTLRPRGPYALRLVAGGTRGGTARFADGVLALAFEADGAPACARVWQQRDGLLQVRLDSPAPDAALARLRFLLATEDDHTEFLRRFARDPLLGDVTRRLQGLRPLRTATVAHALLRAMCGQLIQAREAARIEARIVASVRPQHGGLRLPPGRDDLAGLSPAWLASRGLAARRGAALVRVLRELDPERLHEVDTPTAVARLVRERTLGPWSAGVVCVEGLGRYDHGLVGDLGLVKLATVLLRRPATSEDTEELLAPYGEWAGLASVYLLAGVRVDPKAHGTTHWNPTAGPDRPRRSAAAA
ncbi:MAG: hypothetical protein R3C15_20730 [Thermoleophilia bacterium]